MGAYIVGAHSALYAAGRQDDTAADTEIGGGRAGDELTDIVAVEGAGLAVEGDICHDNPFAEKDVADEGVGRPAGREAVARSHLDLRIRDHGQEEESCHQERFCKEFHRCNMIHSRCIFYTITKYLYIYYLVDTKKNKNVALATVKKS